MATGDCRRVEALERWELVANDVFFLDCFVQSLRGTKDQDSRLALLHLLGRLGLPNIYLLSSRESKASKQELELSARRGSNEYYLAVVISELSKLATNPYEQFYHSLVNHALGQIIRYEQVRITGTLGCYACPYLLCRPFLPLHPATRHYALVI